MLLDLVDKPASASYRKDAYARLQLWLDLLARLEGCEGPVLIVDEAENLYRMGVSRSERRTALRSLAHYCGGALPRATVILAVTPDTLTALRDEAGYFKILGRTSVDILKSGGYKLSALEIEEALREHEAVAEVAVVGLPDETWGDRVVACVVPRAGREGECADAALRAFAKERLAPYKVPKEIVVFGELPRNAIGKVVKPELVKMLVIQRA